MSQLFAWDGQSTGASALASFLPKKSQVYTPTTNDKKIELERFYDDLQDLLELTSKKDVLFIIGDWNIKVGSQEIPGIKGKFDLGVQNEAGQTLTEFCQENALVIANTLFWHMTSPDGHTKIRLIIFFVAKDGEALYISKNKIRSWLCLRSWTPYCQIQT